MPRSALLTIYKLFVRPHLDYSDVIYDNTYIDSFHSKLKAYQYDAALLLTGAIKGSSGKKLYEELGLQTLYKRDL